MLFKIRMVDEQLELRCTWQVFLFVFKMVLAAMYAIFHGVIFDRLRWNARPLIFLSNCIFITKSSQPWVRRSRILQFPARHSEHLPSTSVNLPLLSMFALAFSGLPTQSNIWPHHVAWAVVSRHSNRKKMLGSKSKVQNLTSISVNLQAPMIAKCWDGKRSLKSEFCLLSYSKMNCRRSPPPNGSTAHSLCKRL